MSIKSIRSAVKVSENSTINRIPQHSCRPSRQRAKTVILGAAVGTSSRFGKGVAVVCVQQYLNNNNSIPSSIRSSTSADTFRRLLKTHCFQQAYCSYSGSAKCLRFGHWLTLCTLNIHILTYLLTYNSNRSNSVQITHDDIVRYNPVPQK